MLSHELERRLDADNKSILDIRKTISDYCKSLGKERAYNLFKNIIEETTGKIKIKQDWGISDLEKKGVTDLGDADISKKYFDIYKWKWIQERGTVHFNLVDLDISKLEDYHKDILKNKKFMDFIKTHKIDY